MSIIDRDCIWPCIPASRITIAVFCLTTKAGATYSALFLVYLDELLTVPDIRKNARAAYYYDVNIERRNIIVGRE